MNLASEFKDLQQHYKKPLNYYAKKYGVTRDTVYRNLKNMDKAISRETYIKNASKRRKIAYELKQQGYSWQEVADILEITVTSAKQLGYRYKKYELNKS